MFDKTAAEVVVSPFTSNHRTNRYYTILDMDNDECRSTVDYVNLNSYQRPQSKCNFLKFDIDFFFKCLGTIKNLTFNYPSIHSNPLISYQYFITIIVNCLQIYNIF